MKRSIILVSLFTAIFSTEALSDIFVYKIEATKCQGRDSTSASGFSTPNRTAIITALHSVIGCKEIIARIGGRKISGLTIGHFDKRRDIAALQKSGLDIPASEWAAVKPRAGEKLSIIGHPHGSSGLITTPVVAEDPRPVRPLSGLLSEDQVGPFLEAKSPHPAIEVIHLFGPIQVGHSGAPLVNSKKQVIGVALGGIGKGEYSRGWAVPLGDVDYRENNAITREELKKLIEVGAGRFSYSGVRRPDPSCVDLVGEFVELVPNNLTGFQRSYGEGYTTRGSHGPRPFDEVHHEVNSLHKKTVSVLRKMDLYDTVGRAEEEIEWFRENLRYIGMCAYYGDPTADAAFGEGYCRGGSKRKRMANKFYPMYKKMLAKIC